MEYFAVADPTTVGFDCTETEFDTPNSGTEPADDAVVATNNLQATVTNSIENIVGPNVMASGTARYCVRVTLCGRIGASAASVSGSADGDSCASDPTVGRSLVDVEFQFDINGATVISGSTTAIDVEETSTVFSEEFAVEAVLVAATTDCNIAAGTITPVPEAFTGDPYHICIYTADASDRQATSIVSIGSWQLTTSNPDMMQDDTDTGVVPSSCETTAADSCFTNAFTLDAGLVPEGESRAVTGFVDATMVIDGRRRRRKLQFEVGTEGALREPLSFVASRNTGTAGGGSSSNNDDPDKPSFCDGFLGIIFFWICWIFHLF